MVCKECGAYNAEHLTHCRVCAAKLKDAEPAAETVDAGQEEASARPTRRFAQAPKWPTNAYTVKEAPQQPVSDEKSAETAKVEPAQDEPQKSADAAAEKPAEKPVEKSAAVPVSAAPVVQAPPRTASVRAAAPMTENKQFCTACGKPLMPDAMFCAYCGAKTAAAAAAAPAPAAAPTPAAPTKMNARSAYQRRAESSEPEEEKTRPAKRVAAPSKKQQLAAFDEDDDLEEKNDDFSDLYDEDEDFDDEYYDDEFDEDEDDDMPKRKGKGGTILFVVLIVVLLALVGFFGKYIINKNYGGSFSNMIAALTGKQQETPANEENDPDVNVVSNTTSDAPSATIVEDTINGTEVFNITVNAPNGTKVRIVDKSGTLQEDSTTIAEGNSIHIAVPRSIYTPTDYCDSTTVSVTPEVEVTLPDGTTKMLDVPSVTMTVPQVSLTLTAPVGESVEATADGSPIKIEGTVTDHTTKVFVNGTEVTVFEGGTFSYDYTPTAEENQTIVVEAKKAGCMGTSQTIAVTPHVVKALPLALTSQNAVIKAADGKAIVEGTAVPGATITAICENSNVTCGAVSVTETGSFTCVIEVPKEGYYEVNFAATAEGYDNAAVTCTIERKPTTKSSSYKEKALNLNKNYEKVAGGQSDATTLKFTGKVKEIIPNEAGLVIFKLEDSAGNVVYVCNRSDKNKIENNDLNKSKTVAGYNAGLYPETTNPYIWGWFIWNN